MRLVIFDNALCRLRSYPRVRAIRSLNGFAKLQRNSAVSVREAKSMPWICLSQYAQSHKVPLREQRLYIATGGYRAVEIEYVLAKSRISL